MLGIDSTAVIGHPIGAPLYLLKQVFLGKKVKYFVFRYINDSNSLVLAYLRYISEIILINFCKLLNIQIWWLCHNVDKETTSFYPKITKLRRQNVLRNANQIFTTNKLLVPFAKQTLKVENIDFLSLGYISGKLSEKFVSDEKINNQLRDWLHQKKGKNVKFLFCIGSPADKATHFKLINSFILKLNNIDNIYRWYGVVVGHPVNESKYIFNIPTKHYIDPKIILDFANYYYRVIDDYSISYSIFEAAEYNIPIITENYGILPDIIKYYKIGYVVESIEKFIESVGNEIAAENFNKFRNDNNWNMAAKKIALYYNR
ncbi:glycosyltransferase [Sphingobacterium sp. SGL-16]|uniref:glycosyltransferase n=1 Tax=Sphingobacterium sp. SGL-16 TaxID=2710883 RepID=UPI0013EB95CF|nr:glycosyltransferase [Sphingobacterium sp. SGL-16]NGM73072.1 glycosyltransferase [Sphingobacterium sp. SGL-16]